MNPISINLTLDEHIHAYWQCEKLANRRLLILRWFLLVPMYAGFCLGVFQFFKDALNRQLHLEGSDVFYLGPFMMMMALTFWSRLSLRNIRKQFTDAYQFEQRKAISIRLSDDGYYSDLAINEQHSFEWNEFDRYLETRSIFALVSGTRFFPTPNHVFFPIPKHALSESQQRELHDFLSSNFVKFRKKPPKK